MKALNDHRMDPSSCSRQEKMSNDCAFLSITEEAGEGLEMLGFYHRMMTTLGRHCGLIPQSIEG